MKKVNHAFWSAIERQVRSYAYVYIAAGRTYVLLALASPKLHETELGRNENQRGTANQCRQLHVNLPTSYRLSRRDYITKLKLLLRTLHSDWTRKRKTILHSGLKNQLYQILVSW